MADLQSIISANVDLLLQEQGISQAELARKIGMKPQQLNPYLKGGVKMPVAVLEAIRKGFDVGLERLIGTPPPPQNFRKPTPEEIGEVFLKGLGLPKERTEALCALIRADDTQWKDALVGLKTVFPHLSSRDKKQSAL